MISTVGEGTNLNVTATSVLRGVTFTKTILIRIAGGTPGGAGGGTEDDPTNIQQN